MKRHSAKKGSEKPKKSAKTKESSQKKGINTQHKNNDVCKHCSTDLSGNERALFVEEEVGRIFCSESCIANFFNPEIQKLEKDYFKRLSPSDLSGDEREKLAHLRWMTLQEPDEVWREKTLSGDYRFTLISEFKPDEKKIWCVCICLFLRGEPSFLYLAFPTRNAAMTNYYRKGERVQMVRQEQGKTPGNSPSSEETDTKPGFIDGLADAWTEDETIRAQITRNRRIDDIPSEEFSLYQSCLEETLQAPDEVWSSEIKEKHSLKLYHFLRHYPEESSGIWYVVIARETDENEEEIEILDAFPTRDPELVEQFRRGTQEIGAVEEHTATRMVH